MKLIFILIYLFVTWYTLKYARIVWKQGQKLSSIIITVLALTLIALAIYV